MRAIAIVGEIDDDHQIRAEAPRDLPPGRIQLIVVRQDEDESGAFWPRDVSQAWSDELADAHQDIYTLADGQPFLHSVLPNPERVFRLHRPGEL